MPIGNAGMWSKTAHRRQGLASLAPLFVLALLLASLLSPERAVCFFQSPISPLPPTEEAPLPTGTPTPSEVRSTATPATPEAVSTGTPTPSAVRPTLSSPTPEAVLTATPTAPPTVEGARLSPVPTDAAFLPAVQVAGPATVSPAVETSARAGLAVWPWILLVGLLSVGAMVAGVFLLRREVSAKDGEGTTL